MKRIKIKTHILIALLLFGGMCFGCGVLYGQHLLIADGFLYQENAGDTSKEGEDEDASVETESVASTSRETSSVEPPADKARVSLNHGTVEELSAVEGIGTRTAGKIVASRKAEGNFSSVEDLVVRGILGKNKLDQIKAYLVVD